MRVAVGVVPPPTPVAVAVPRTGRVAVPFGVAVRAARVGAAFVAVALARRVAVAFGVFAAGAFVGRAILIAVAVGYGARVTTAPTAALVGAFAIWGVGVTVAPTSETSSSGPPLTPALPELAVSSSTSQISAIRPHETRNRCGPAHIAGRRPRAAALSNEVPCQVT